jgi:hypothetical protein
MLDDESLNIATRCASRRRRRRWLWIALLILCVLFSIRFWRPLFAYNLGVVDSGRVYRSEQPGEWLSHWSKTHSLKSVLNLRGGSFHDPFYATEVQITRDRGVAFYDFPLSASRRPSRRELLTLLNLFERCEYPVLIHCKRGADRTGLVSALYLLAVKRCSPQEAEQAFSLDHAHISIPGSTAQLHAPLQEYAGWLKDNQRTHSPELFRSWVESEYLSAPLDDSFRPLQPGPRKLLADRARTAELAPTAR